MSRIRYRLDENIDRVVFKQVRKLEPSIDIHCVGELGFPPLGSSDPNILKWLEKAGYILITENRKTIPTHFSNHIEANRHLPGIFVVTKQLSHMDLVEELILIWETTESEEFKDIILYLPLSY